QAISFIRMGNRSDRSGDRAGRPSRSGDFASVADVSSPETNLAPSQTRDRAVLAKYQPRATDHASTKASRITRPLYSRQILRLTGESEFRESARCSAGNCRWPGRGR